MSGYPWKNGYYRFASTTLWIIKIDNENLAMYHTGCLEKQLEMGVSEAMKGTLKYGSFGEAPTEIVEKTGNKMYDFEMILWDGEMITHATITDNGTRMVMKSMFPNSGPLDELFLLRF